jgi:hypothetical protein
VHITKYYEGVRISEDEMGRTCNIHVVETYINILVGRFERKEDHWGYLGMGDYIKVGLK